LTSASHQKNGPYAASLRPPERDSPRPDRQPETILNRTVLYSLAQTPPPPPRTEPNPAAPHSKLFSCPKCKRRHPHSDRQMNSPYPHLHDRPLAGRFVGTDKRCRKNCGHPVKARSPGFLPDALDKTKREGLDRAKKGRNRLP